ncbi:Sua5/YciO/YrdC/YwlC family protein, partial [Francisella tularensis]|uniref:Sua5/YciO/YrdC/YwlC family protein n=1 Tax=Francisella tularensis TaxID=263 RepID=UPI002381B582
IAIRLVTTEIVTYFCENINDAIISTSSNISGEDFINNAKSISKNFDNIYVLETEVRFSKPSRIIDIISGQQYR